MNSPGSVAPAENPYRPPGAVGDVRRSEGYDELFVARCMIWFGVANLVLLWPSGLAFIWLGYRLRSGRGCSRAGLICVQVFCGLNLLFCIVPVVMALAETPIAIDFYVTRFDSPPLWVVFCLCFAELLIIGIPLALTLRRNVCLVIVQQSTG